MTKARPSAPSHAWLSGEETREIERLVVERLRDWWWW